MSGLMSQISLVFDIVITCLLGATIYFAVKLSRHLDSFRANRSTMEGLIRELSNQITRAQEGISVLDELSANRGDELRSSIAKAQALSDELQLMTESGNSLAERLETMAVRNRAIIDEMDQKAMDLVYPKANYAAAPASPPPELTASRVQKFEETLTRAKAEKPSESFFHIRDPDFESGDDQADDSFESAQDQPYTSQAERDLAEALKRRMPKGK